MTEPAYANWTVVWRKNKPIAAFMSRSLAIEWIASEPHRDNDELGTWSISEQKKKYWREAQQRSRQKRKPD